MGTPVTGTQSEADEAQRAPRPENSLVVALYPYMYAPEAFEKYLKKHWHDWQVTHNLKPVDLSFCYYNCYQEDPRRDLDVFVFDSLFLPHLANERYLLPFSTEDIPSQDASEDSKDFMQFAFDACHYDEKPYGRPVAACAQVYFCRRQDIEMNQDLTLSAMSGLVKVPGLNTSVIPPAGRGLVLDLTWPLVCLSLYGMAYLETHWKDQERPSYPPLPTPSSYDTTAIANLQTVCDMAGWPQLTFREPEVFDTRTSIKFGDYSLAGTVLRREWFTSVKETAPDMPVIGRGRAYVAYPELLAYFHDDARRGERLSLDYLAFRALPLWDPPSTDVSAQGKVAHVDMAGINSQIEPWKYRYAVELVTMMASHEVLLAYDNDPANPRFTLPVRHSVLNYLVDHESPVHQQQQMYQDMRDYLVPRIKVALQFDPSVREWIDRYQYWWLYTVLYNRPPMS
jgi:thiamine pyridinylase